MGECGITITQSQTANWSATEGKAVMEAWLKQSKDIQGVFAQNDEMGMGAAQAIKEAGLKPAPTSRSSPSMPPQVPSKP